MFERTTLIGRLGADPEMRYTPAGVPVTVFDMATTRTISGDRPCPEGWKQSRNGKSWELTTWWTVTCWRDLAETVNQYLSKGRQVYVEGEIDGKAADGVQRPGVWTGQDGIARANYELTARLVKFLDSQGKTEEAEGTDTLPF